MSMPRTLVILGAVFCAVTSATADGPWTQRKGGGYLQLSYTVLPGYSTLWEQNGNTIELDREVFDKTIMAYLEYGVADDLTAIFEMPIKKMRIDPESGQAGPATRSATALGNAAVGIKKRFVNRKILIAGQLKLHFKASNSDDDLAQGLRSGTDSWGISPSIHIGGSYGAAYAFIHTGVRLRSDDYSNEWLLNSELGVRLFRGVWVIGVFDAKQTLSDGSHDTSPTLSGLYPDNQEFVAYGTKLIADLTPKIGLNFSSFSGLDGHLVARSPSRTVGIYYKW